MLTVLKRLKIIFSDITISVSDVIPLQNMIFRNCFSATDTLCIYA
jgi:hypothetical protein